VLQLARSERNGFLLELTPVDLHEIMTAAATAFAPHIELDLTATNPIIRADRYHLETMLNNLIDNALKYCDKQPCIVLHTHTERGTLRWSVGDNGMGIAPEHQQAIFRQFFRVQSGHTHTVKGFGLGLYYVRQIIRAHGWTLTLTSKPGEGSTFVISERIAEDDRITSIASRFALLRVYTRLFPLLRP
jgi:two-component system phosphate regulon sensor histidine kinase PhoR